MIFYSWSKNQLSLPILAPIISLLVCSCDRSGGNDGEVTKPSEKSVPPAEQPVMRVDPNQPLSDAQKKQVIDQIMQARAREQAQGLGSGSVTVNGAWHYEGYSYLSPNPNAGIKARLVAVDLTASGHKPTFDFDDVEIVDGTTMMSYGSDPHATPLDIESGQPLAAGQTLPLPPRASRWLMIYAFPEATDRFHLYYWGKQLTPKPVSLQESGWSLPYPQ